MKERDEKFINLRPIVLSAIAFVGGIFCVYRSFLHGNWVTLIFAILLSFLLLLTTFIKTSVKKKTALWLCFIFFFFSLGYLLADYKIQQAKNAPYNGYENTFTGRIYKINQTSYGTFVYLDGLSLQDENMKSEAKLFIPNNMMPSKIDLGAVIKCEAKIVNRILNDDISNEVFLGVHYELANLQNISVIDFEADFYELVYLKARTFIKQNLSDEGRGIALALILGDTSYITTSNLENYRFAGIAHVFAISGLHMGIVVSIFTYLAKKLKTKRIITPFIILIPAFIYCGVCGFRPSTLRAFIMSAVTVIANFCGFKKDNLSSSALAGLLILIISPFYLFDYGFKLSFLAVSAIFALCPLFIRHSEPLKIVGEPLSVSLSAQLGTLPVLCKMSGYTSIISIFTNLIFVPVAVVIYVFTFICFCFSALVSSFISGATVIMQAPDFLITVFNFLTAKIDFSIFAIPTDFGIFSIVWYVWLACISDLTNFTARQKILITVFSLIAVFGGICLNTAL